MPPSDKQQDPLIEAADFRSIEIKIALVNLDTSVEIRDGKKTYRVQGSTKTAPAGEIRICEITGPKGVVLDIPSDICEKGQKIRLEVSARNVQPPLKLSLVVEVRKIERDAVLTYGNDDVERVAAAQDRIAAEIVECGTPENDENEWARLKSLFVSRQSEIDAFFKAVKGF